MISLNIVKCWLSTICKIRVFCEAYFANEGQNIYCQGVAGVLLSPFGAALPQGEGHGRKADGGGGRGVPRPLRGGGRGRGSNKPSKPYNDHNAGCSPADGGGVGIARYLRESPYYT